ncbi:hypothetical protein PI124_g16030 [Phytophthora idaei]|nr:hypothetical protein PI124_g16030 [Phytophthora idaei]
MDIVPTPAEEEESSAAGRRGQWRCMDGASIGGGG